MSGLKENATAERVSELEDEAGMTGSAYKACSSMLQERDLEIKALKERTTTLESKIQLVADAAKKGVLLWVGGGQCGILYKEDFRIICDAVGVKP